VIGLIFEALPRAPQWELLRDAVPHTFAGLCPASLGAAAGLCPDPTKTFLKKGLGFQKLLKMV